MDIKSNHSAPVLTDPVPISKSRLGIHSSLLPYSPGGVFASGMYIAIPRKKAIPSKLDDVRASIWLDAMKYSSPPRKKITKDSNIEVASDDSQRLIYRSWMLKYPSALTSFEKIMNYSKGKRIALFLDYDGTLAPIIDDPEKAFMSDDMRSAVRDVAKYFPTAIISGRSRDKVSNFVKLTELYYAGSHGMDIIGPVRQSGNGDNHSNCIRTTDKQIHHHHQHNGRRCCSSSISSGAKSGQRRAVSATDDGISSNGFMVIHVAAVWKLELHPRFLMRARLRQAASQQYISM